MEQKQSVSVLKQVGEQRLKKFNQMGIETIGDLLTHYPREYKDRSRLVKIADLSETEENTFIAYVRGQGKAAKHGKLVVTRLKVFDDTGEVNVVWYNQPYMKNALQMGEAYLFTGVLQKKYRTKEVVSPEYEKIGEHFAGGRIVPVYPTVKGISQKMLRGYLEMALSEIQGTLEEYLPAWLRKKYFLF